MLGEAAAVRLAAAKQPEYQDLVGKLSALYDEITRKALENEQKPRPKPKRRKIWPAE